MENAAPWAEVCEPIAPAAAWAVTEGFHKAAALPAAGLACGACGRRCCHVRVLLPRGQPSLVQICRLGCTHAAGQQGSAQEEFAHGVVLLSSLGVRPGCARWSPSGTTW